MYSSSDPKAQQIALNMFCEESKYLQSLGKHPQVPELLAYFDVGGQPYLVQQYIDGEDLEKELEKEGAFDQQKIREILESLLPVLDFLHNQPKPVIHRDIKPANIIRRRMDGVLMLVDFGAAKQATQTMLAKTGTIIGSPEYMAPEQLRGNPIFASDIYSLGVTCIHLLTNMPPFHLFDVGEDDWVWRNYLVDNPVSNLLGEVLNKLIVNSLAHRYKSASDVLKALCSQTSSTAVNVVPVSSQSSSVAKPSATLQLHRSPMTFETAQLVQKLTEQQVNGSSVTMIVQEWEVQKSTGSAECYIEDLGNGVRLEMVYVPHGKFMMGAPAREGRDSEKPQYLVTLPGHFSLAAQR